MNRPRANTCETDLIRSHRQPFRVVLLRRLWTVPMIIILFVVVTAALPVLLIGAWIAGYYIYELRKQELRDWRIVKVTFTDVGGLKHKSTVMLNGSPMGRVSSVRLYGDRHLVTMELDPRVVLFNDLQVEVVPTSALGTVGLEINPHTREFNANLPSLTRSSWGRNCSRSSRS